MKNLFNKKNLQSLYLIFLGVITSFSLPPYNFFIINFLTFSLFFIFVVKKKKQLNKISYFKFGWFFGFGYFLSSLYWIVIALTFEENLKILIPVSLILIPAFLAIFYGLALYFFSFFIGNKNISLVLTFSIIFGFLEFIRGNILTGFPWNLIAFSFSNNIYFIQILSLIGTYSFNMICITFFLIPAIFILRKSNKEIFLCISLIFVGLCFLIFGVQKINNKNLVTNNSDYVIKVVSSKISIKKFYNLDNEQEIIKDLINLSQPNLDIPTIFVWPEGVLTSSSLNDIKQYKNLFKENFSDKHLIILGMSDLVKKNNNELKIYNSLVIVDRNLDVKNLYYKNNLVPFGEFLPLENFLSKLGLKTVTNQFQSFSSGNNRQVISITDDYFNLYFLPLICYEIIYSGKLSSDKNFDFIINISEDGWFGNSVGPFQHFAHSIFRSIEEGVNVIRSSNNGISAYINNKGQVKEKIESTQSGVIEINHYNKKNRTFFSIHGNNIFFYFLIIYIIFIFFINLNNQKKQ